MINNQKDLQALFKLCRKQGVKEFAMGEIKIVFGELPEERASYTDEDEVDSENTYANFPKGYPTNEELMFYSSGGDPADDPENKPQ